MPNLLPFYRRILTLRDTLITPHSPDYITAQREYMTRMILVLLNLTAILFFTGFTYAWLNGQLPLVSVCITIGMTITLALALRLAHHGHWQPLSYLPPALFFALAVVINYLEGVGAVAMLQYALVVMLVAMLQGGWKQWVALLLCIAAYTTIGYLHATHQIPAPPVPEQELWRWTIPASGMWTFITVAQSFYTTQFHHHLTALQNLNATLEQRVTDRTHELESFAYTVSHDLRSPLRALDGYVQALQEDYGPQLDETAREYLAEITTAATRMGDLITDILHLSRLSRSVVTRTSTDLSALATEILAQLQRREPQRAVQITIQPHLHAYVDLRLIQIALENLLDNAWKYTSKRTEACIIVGQENDTFFVYDNGAGFDDTKAAPILFQPFKRLHPQSEFPGTGIGLATVKQIIQKHHGKIWAESQPDQGTTFYFTLSKER